MTPEQDDRFIELSDYKYGLGDKRKKRELTPSEEEELQQLLDANLAEGKAEGGDYQISAARHEFIVAGAKRLAELDLLHAKFSDRPKQS